MGIEVALAPPSLYLIPLLESIRKDIKVAAQNCYTKSSGAYTGEIRLVTTAIRLWGLGLSNAILPAQRSSSTPKFHL